MFDERQQTMGKDRLGTYFAMIVVSAFLGELVTMVALDAVAFDSPVLEAFVDSILLSVLLGGVTYVFMLRPFQGTLDLLRRTRMRYRSVVDAGGGMVFILDPEGRIREANRPAAEALRLAERDLYGRRLAEFAPLSSGDGGPETPIETVMRRSDGTEFDVSLRMGHSTPDPVSGTDEDIVVLGTDISERKKYERSLEERTHFLQTLIDAIPAPVFVKDANMVYLSCNRAFEGFIGRPREEVVGKSVFGIAPRELAEVYQKADQDLFRQGGTQIYDAEVHFADGSLHQVEFHKAVFHDPKGERNGIIGVMLDLSRRHRTGLEPS